MCSSDQWLAHALDLAELNMIVDMMQWGLLLLPIIACALAEGASGESTGSRPFVQPNRRVPGFVAALITLFKAGPWLFSAEISRRSRSQS